MQQSLEDLAEAKLLNEFMTGGLHTHQLYLQDGVRTLSNFCDKLRTLHYYISTEIRPSYDLPGEDRSLELLSSTASNIASLLNQLEGLINQQQQQANLVLEVLRNSEDAIRQLDDMLEGVVY